MLGFIGDPHPLTAGVLAVAGDAGRERGGADVVGGVSGQLRARRASPDDHDLVPVDLDAQGAEVNHPAGIRPANQPVSSSSFA